MDSTDFSELLWEKGHELYRDMPWRNDTRPYYVLVSELMLQQTQVTRVVPKFEAFVERFPDEVVLANASLAEVLKYWQGLGYNRRAKYLHETAKMIVTDFNGTFPNTYNDLIKLPGVGKNTAGAILAYSFNLSAVFIETNIRTVYIHHFFSDNFDVDDKQIIELLEATIDHANPRTFYWSLMDYGATLKASGIKNISQSRHYKKQAPLEGSLREMRGFIVKELVVGDKTMHQLRHLSKDERFLRALDGLISDGLVAQGNNKIHLTK